MGITNTGFAGITDRVGDVDSIAKFNYLAVGSSNTAFAVTQTALGSEITGNGLARVAATVTQQTTTVTDDTLRLNTVWTVSGTETIKEAGIFNASSGGVMLARKVLGTARAVAEGDSFQYTYEIVAA